jgi:hypothetical protein
MERLSKYVAEKNRNDMHDFINRLPPNRKTISHLPEAFQTVCEQHLEIEAFENSTRRCAYSAS